MKCPRCHSDLTPTKRDGVDMETCPSCQGMWLTSQELTRLEDEVFDLGDDEKGSLVFSPAATTDPCPQCGQPMQRFGYRLYDVEMDFCPAAHGFWLDAGEDKRVLDIMKKEERDLERTVLAQDKWATRLKHLRSPSFLDKMRRLLP